MKPLHLLVIAAAVYAPVANAADDAALLAAPEITISREVQRDWYLRGDIGFAPWRDADSPRYSAGAGSDQFDDTRFGRPFSGSIGIGHRIGDTLRADLTGDVFASELDGAFQSAAPCSGEVAGTTCSYEGSADFRAYGIMLNGYVDLANVAGFTPYLGAGVGVTRIVWDDFDAEATCGGAGCTGTGATATFGGEDSWRFTYALMAGMTYAITDRIKLDIGYRYSDIAGGDMFDGPTGQGEDDGFTRHEFRTGLHVAF